MSKAVPEQRFGHLLPIAVLGIGIALTLVLQLYSRDGVLFSGDGGLKALLAQQWAAGVWQFDLRIPVAGWIEALWQQGLYPFTPPYVYEQGDRFFITFPFTFPLVTAPFYGLLGYRGLYVVPVVALWAVWWRMAQIGRRLQLAAPVLAAGLVSAVLAAPLIIYGAMYWEHTLAVALAFWGVSMALFPKKDSLGLMEAIAAGILVGLSVWFRPEFLCLVAILGGLLAVSVFKIKSLAWLNPAPGRIWAFGLAMVATVLIFFGLNMVIYGHPLGIHALQIVEESSLKQQVKQAIASYRQLVGSLVTYFPLVWFVMAMAIASLWVMPLRLNPRSRLVLLLCGAFVLMVPLIIPPGAGGKQWGPRFYLVLVPLLSLLAAQQLQQSWRLGGRIRYLPVVLLAATCFLGIYGNLYGATWGQQRNQTYGSVPLSGNYGPIAPAIAALAEQDSSYLAMSHQFVAQQLWPALPDKIFFRTETAEATQTLGAGLLDQGIEQFIYICYPHRDCPVPELPGDELTFRHRDGTYRLEFSLLGELGKYPTHRVDLVALE